MKQFFKTKKNIIAFFQLCILALWALYSGVDFFVALNKYETESFQTKLESVAKSNAKAVEIAFEKYIHFLKMSGEFFKTSTYDREDFVAAINNTLALEDFSSIAVILPSGVSYVSYAGGFSFANYEFTEKMHTHEIIISDIYYDIYLDDLAVSVSVPLLTENNELLAYLVGILSVEDLSALFNQTFYDLGGYYHVVDEHGAYVANSNSDNMLLMDISFYDAMNMLEYNEGYSVEKFFNDIENKTANICFYNSEGNERMAYYVPININNWIMYSVIPHEIVEEEFSPVIKIAFTFAANIVAVFAMLIIWIYRVQRDLIVLAEENERNFRFMATQTKKYIMEWDFITETIKVTGDFEHLFPSANGELVLPFMKLQEFIHTEDIQKTLLTIQQLKNGEKISGFKLRIIIENGTIAWAMFSAIPLATATNTKAFDKAVGFMENITEQELESAKLRKMSELDSLTQIFNKGTTENKIKHILNYAEPYIDTHSLLIIDLDNFKNLNDTFGHQFGDEVLVEFANHLKTLFRQNDIVGRVGGDEFFVFMKSISSQQLVLDKCSNIIQTFDKEYQAGDTSVEISVSIGVAMFPRDGENFKELYKNADIALYSAKEKGKNNYQFYDGTQDIKYVSSRTAIESMKRVENKES